MVEAYADVYGGYSLIEPKQLNQQRLDELKAQFASWDWLYGRSIQFDHQPKDRLAGGSVDLQLHADKGFTKFKLLFRRDGSGFYTGIKKQLLGCRYTEKGYMCSWRLPIHAAADEVEGIDS